MRTTEHNNCRARGSGQRERPFEEASLIRRLAFEPVADIICLRNYVDDPIKAERMALLTNRADVQATNGSYETNSSFTADAC